MKDDDKTKEELIAELVELRKFDSRGLGESEQRYGNLLEAIEDGYYEVDIKGNTTFFNSAYCKIMGYPRAELEGINYRTYMDKPTSDMTFQIFNGVYKTGKPVEVYDYEIIRKDGAKRTCSISVSLMKDDQGQPCGFRGMLRDVTERKRVEEALQAAHAELKQRVDERTQELRRAYERLSLALDGANLGIWDWDLTTGKAVWTERTHRTLGYEPNEVIPDLKGWKHLIHPDDWPKASEKLNLHLDGREPLFEIEHRMLNKSGDWQWIQGRGKVVERNPDGNPIRMTGVLVDIDDRKKAEDSLRESEERFRLVMEATNDGVWDWDLKTNHVFRSPGFFSMLGYQEEEFRGRFGEWQNVVHPEDLVAVTQALNEYLNGTRETYEVEFRMLRKSGEPVWVLSRGKVVVRDANGEPLRMVGTHTDITGRKKVDEALRASEDRYRGVFENAAIGIDVVDAEGRFLQVNSSLAQMLGYSEDELLKMTIFDVSHPDDVEVSRIRHEKMLHRETESYRFEKRYLRKDGEVLWADISVSPVRGPDGSYVSTVGAIADITASKRAKTALQESEERYRKITENSLTGIFVFQDDRSVYANRRLTEMLGYTPEEVLSMPFLEAIHPDDRDMAKEMAQARLADQPVSNHCELRLLRKDGHTVWSEVLSHRIDYEGHPAILGNIADVTQRKILEDQLRQAQKMEAVGTLAGGIAHDFNNLLQITLGYSEVLLSEKTEKDPDYADLQKIHQAARSGAELVRNLLTFSRKTEPKPLHMCLNKEIRHVEKLLHRTIPRMIDIRLDLAEDLERINADPAQIEQIIMNLAVNARDAMDEEGSLTLRTENVTLDQEYCRLNVEAKPGDYVLLSVSDTGHGIDKATLQHIFEPFYTTKELGRGTGLGLAMVYGIVKQHGGHIHCHSEVGKGTIFMLYFPAIPSMEKHAVEVSGIMPAFGTETVLLVDDEEGILELGERILTRSGYTVLTANNGEVALEVYGREKERIALVILDLIMPTMGGKDCLKRILEIDPHARILIASGHSADASTKECVELGAKGFVAKPFRFKELLRRVRKTLDQD